MRFWKGLEAEKKSSHRPVQRAGEEELDFKDEKREIIQKDPVAAGERWGIVQLMARHERSTPKRKKRVGKALGNNPIKGPLTRGGALRFRES